MNCKRLTITVELTRLFEDRLEENVERQLILDDGIRNEVLHIIKRKLQNGAFKITEYEFDLE